MQILNIHQAKTNLLKLIEAVLKGQDVVIAKAGKTVARLIIYKEIGKKRKPGLLKGKISMSKDFTEEDEKINKLFQGL